MKCTSTHLGTLPEAYRWISIYHKKPCTQTHVRELRESIYKDESGETTSDYTADTTFHLVA